MKVYRIENQDTGKGPYTCKNSGIDISTVKNIYTMHETHNEYTELFPGLYSDFSYEVINKVISFGDGIDTLFGFTSIEKLEQWFNIYLKDLLESKVFVIKEYNVEDEQVFMGDSGKQCIFVINRSVEGMGKVVPFEVTKEMQSNYVKMYEDLMDSYWEWAE